ncbi:MAG: RNA methyltransferase [Betaproteobacteria bacterium]|nr:RNA methyltransferase [Betaproteobacteria bacterium]
MNPAPSPALSPHSNPANALANIRIVLCQTSHPGNIGSTARAMKTMGLSRLVLVAPQHFPHPEADALASGATDVLANARVTATLDEALAGTVLAIGMTARRRDLSHPMLGLREAAQRLLDNVPAGQVALVFGTEMFGLSNDELDRCQLAAHIPTNPDYSSLNLAAAVQVAAYEIAMTASVWKVPEAPPRESASHDELERFYAHLEQSLIASRFLNPDMPKRLMTRLRRLFARASLEKEEVNILRGILTARDRWPPDC